MLYLSHLGESYISLANYSDSATALKTRWLITAIERIKQSQIDNHDHLFADEAWLTLGNAHEDLAWLVKIDVDQNYDAATKAFGEAKRIALDPAPALASLGHCYYGEKPTAISRATWTWRRKT